MEFLDPEERKLRAYKLFFAYGLIVFLIVAGTFILSFALQGLDLFSRQTEVRNGLLFVDSKPVSAQININGDTSKRTDSRFVLPEGNYNIKLTENGYREWQKDIVVQGGKVVYHVYPKLIPDNIVSETGYTFGPMPQLYSQSPDRRYIVATDTVKLGQFITIDTDSPTTPPKSWVVPDAIWNAVDATTNRLEPVEWSTDNKHLLVAKISQDGAKQYLMLNQDKPDESIDLSAQFKLKTTDKIALRDKKYNQFYILDNTTKDLKRASLDGGIDPAVLASGVVEFSVYGNDTILYATTLNADQNKVAVKLIRGNNIYSLQSVYQSEIILLDIARFQNNWYVVVGSNKQENSDVYVNPFDKPSQSINATSEVSLQEPNILKPDFNLVLESARFLSFSDNARFIGLQSKEAFSVYDSELKQQYNYSSPVTLPPTGATWMDGHRYSVVSGGKVVIFEYDGKNVQNLSPALDNTQAYYDVDYTNLFTLVMLPDSKVAQQINSLVYKPTN